MKCLVCSVIIYRRRNEGYDAFSNMDNEADNGWTFNNPSYGSNNRGKSTFSRLRSNHNGYDGLDE